MPLLGPDIHGCQGGHVGTICGVATREGGVCFVHADIGTGDGSVDRGIGSDALDNIKAGQHHAGDQDHADAQFDQGEALLLGTWPCVCVFHVNSLGDGVVHKRMMAAISTSGFTELQPLPSSVGLMVASSGFLTSLPPGFAPEGVALLALPA